MRLPSFSLLLKTHEPAHRRQRAIFGNFPQEKRIARHGIVESPGNGEFHSLHPVVILCVYHCRIGLPRNAAMESIGHKNKARTILIEHKFEFGSSIGLLQHPQTKHIAVVGRSGLLAPATTASGEKQGNNCQRRKNGSSHNQLCLSASSRSISCNVKPICSLSTKR